MRKHIFIVPFLFLLSIFSCKREAGDYAREDIPATMAQGEIVFNLTSSNAMVTKSQYQESDLKAIHNVWVLAVADDGFWRAKYYTESDLTADGASVTCPSMNFKVGTSVTFYVTANMGDLTDAATPGGVATPSGIEYMIPASVDFSASGMPMAAEPFTRTITANTSVSVLLKPLLARLNITINKNGITDNTVADVLASGAIKVKHANRRLCPFGVSSAYSPEHMFSVIIDKENFSSSVSYDMTHPNVVLYVPENSMGDLLGPGSYTQWDKGNQDAPGKQYATYIEYTGHKNAADDGIGGDVSYRAYLGENETSNYSVNRNTTYNCTLGLTWNGLFYTGDWRVDNSDITDGRRLYLSTTANAASSFTDWGRLRRNVASELYVNFSRDGGASWVHSAKDIDSWPYGWDLYIDGVKQSAGTSATAAGDIGWAYTGAAAGDRLAVTPGPSSVTSTTHTLQIRSADGRVASNEVSFQVSQPLTFSWKAGEPAYVAQKGALQSLDLEDPSASVSYSIKEGEDVIKLSAGSDRQSRMVNLIGPGTATIHAECAATGQDGDITITVLAPTLSVSQDKIYCNPDGQNGRSGVYGTSGSEASFSYKTQQGTVFSQRSASAQESVTGNYLDASLYAQYLKPVSQTESPLLGTSIEQNTTTNLLHVWCRSLSAYPREQGAHIADVMLLPVGGENKADIEGNVIHVYSVDPFIDFPSSASLSSAYDVHDVSLCSIDVSARDYSFTTPTVYAATEQIVVEAMVSPTVNASDNHNDAELATSISYISRKLSWSNKISTRTKSTGGPYSISLAIKNRYSGEALDKEVLKGRLFMHGCIGAEATNSDGLTSQEYYEATGVYPEGGNMYVRTAYFGAPDKYSLDGLGCAYPDVGTNQVEKSYDIEWTDGWGYGQSNEGSVVVWGVETVRSKLKSIGSQVFWVEDGCLPHNGSPQWNHEFYDGYPEGNAELYFYNEDRADYKYRSGKITILDSKTARLRPDNSQSTDGDNGYYYLHLSDVIAGRWL